MRLASDSPRHAIKLRLDTLVVYVIVQFALSKRSIVVPSKQSLIFFIRRRKVISNLIHQFGTKRPVSKSHEPITLLDQDFLRPQHRGLRKIRKNLGLSIMAQITKLFRGLNGVDKCLRFTLSHGRPKT